MTRTGTGPGPGCSVVGLVGYNLLCNKFHVTASNYGEDLPARLPHATCHCHWNCNLAYNSGLDCAAAAAGELGARLWSVVATLPTAKQLA